MCVSSNKYEKQNIKNDPLSNEFLLLEKVKCHLFDKSCSATGNIGMKSKLKDVFFKKLPKVSSYK